MIIQNSMYELNNTTMMKDLSRCYRRIERFEHYNFIFLCIDSYKAMLLPINPLISFNNPQRYTEERKNLMKECDDHASMQQCYLQIELESAGNVTVTIGNPSYSW